MWRGTVGYIDREVQILISDPKLWCYCSLPFYRTKPTAYFISLVSEDDFVTCSMSCHSSKDLHFRTTLAKTNASKTFHSSSPFQGFECTSPMTKLYFVLAAKLLGYP